MENNINLDGLKLICDADPMGKDYDNGLGCVDVSTASRHCPKFGLYNGRIVIFLDKAHMMVEFTPQEFNEMVQKMKSGEIRKTDPMLRSDMAYNIGSISIVRDNETSRIVISRSDGSRASMLPKHFNVFVDAAVSGAMKELNPVRSRSLSS